MGLHTRQCGHPAGGRLRVRRYDVLEHSSERNCCLIVVISADLIISGMEVSSPLHLVTDMSSVSPKKEADSESPVPNGDGDGKMNNEWFRYYDIRRDNGELRQRLRNGETDIDMQRYDTVREEEKKVRALENLEKTNEFASSELELAENSPPDCRRHHPQHP